MTTSPTFVATFADGEITRLTTFAPAGKPNLARGVALAYGAYITRMRNRGEHGLVEVPPMTSARFETMAGEVLAEYGAEQIAEATP